MLDFEGIHENAFVLVADSECKGHGRPYTKDRTSEQQHLHHT